MVPKSERLGRVGESTVSLEFARMGWLYTKTDDKYPCLDGIVEVCKGQEGFTTGLIFGIEVKCGQSHVSSESDREIVLAIEPDPRWFALPFPVVVVYVRAQGGLCFWQEVSSTSIGSRVATLPIPKRQRLTGYSKGDLIRVARRQAHVGGFPVASLPLLDYRELLATDCPQANHVAIEDWAWRRYRSWRESRPFALPYRKPLLVSRRGWRHITRRSLPRVVILQRLLLLPIAEEVLGGDYPVHVMRSAEHRAGRHSLYRQLVRVAIPGRAPAVVSVVVEDVGAMVRFWSVFEHSHAASGSF